MIMTDNQKLEVYGDLLDVFEGTPLEYIVKEIIKETPTIFFGMSVSSSGKYHPKQTNGLMGLVKHSIAVMKTANDFLDNETILKSMGFTKLSELDKLEILAASLLHDNAKYGADEYDTTLTDKIWTRGDHPMLVREIAENAGLLEKLTGEHREILENVLALIETHMGQWNTYKDKDWNICEMPTPETPAQSLVHLADYAVSRKILDEVSELSLPKSINPEIINWFNLQNQ